MTPEAQAALASAIAAAISAGAAVVAAIIAGVALWSQHRAGEPRIRVAYNTPMLVLGGEPSEPFAAIIVHNNGRVPATVKSASVALGYGPASGGIISRALRGRPAAASTPYIGAPAIYGVTLDTLPNRLDPGEAITLFLMPIRALAEIHVGPNGPVRWVEATLAGGREFRSDAINPTHLRSWAAKS